MTVAILYAYARRDKETLHCRKMDVRQIMN